MVYFSQFEQPRRLCALHQASLPYFAVLCTLVTMPFKCVVPGCRSNYSHVKGVRSVPMMRFPLNADMVEAWIKAIHRPGFTPTQHSHVCIKHFRPDEQIWEEYYRQPDGSYRNVTRRHAKLRPSAVPSIFDVDPSQWSMRTTRKRPRRPAPKPDTKGPCEIITGYKVSRGCEYFVVLRVLH